MTPTRERYFLALARLAQRPGVYRGPTYREIARVVGTRYRSTYWAVFRLWRDGYVEIDPGKVGGITLTAQGRAYAEERIGPLEAEGPPEEG